MGDRGGSITSYNKHLSQIYTFSITLVLGLARLRSRLAPKPRRGATAHRGFMLFCILNVDYCCSPTLLLLLSYC